MKNITYISAGAGSGKTYALTHTLADLFANDPTLRPEQVIMTTFSRKAAAELKNKTRELLCERGRYDIAARLDQALIGTVHSIGEALIRKYWYYLGISAKTDVLDENAVERYRDLTAEHTASEEDVMFFDSMLKYFDISKSSYDHRLDWRKNLPKIIENAHCFGINDLDESLKQSLKLIDDAYDFEVQDKALTLNELAIEAKNALTALLDHCPNAGREPKRTRIMDFCKEAIAMIESGKGTDLNFYREQILEPLKNETFGARNCYQIDETLKLAEQIKKAFYYGPEAIEKMREYVKRIFKIAETWKENYKKYKDEHRLLDFNDIESKTIQLLKMPDVIDDIRSSYRYLMVDEFQDSNSVQIVIFKVLADNMEQTWWVGDVKQAIYAFRGSNTELVEKTVADIIDDKDGCHLKNLPKSYRSVPDLVKFSNDIFSRVFSGQKNVSLKDVKPHCPHIEPLKCYKFPVNGNSKINTEYIADLVATMVMDEKYRLAAPRLKDFAILTRDNYVIPNIANELLKLGIPSSYKVKASDTKEWRLMCALLALCDDRNNSLARAHIAHLVAGGYDLTTIIESKLAYDSLPDDAKGKWLDDISLISTAIGFAYANGHLSVSSFVKAMIKGLGLERYSEIWADGNKSVWNAIISMAESYESATAIDGIPTLRGFINYKSEENGDGFSSDAVQIMTYHSAKGLQWPVTILLSLDDDHISLEKIVGKEIYNVSVRKDSASGKHIVCLLPQVETTPHKAVIANLTRSGHTKIFTERTRREESRLLYVGVTRAINQLVLVTHADEKPYNWFTEMGISADLGLIPEPIDWKLKSTPVELPHTPVSHPCATGFKHREPMHVSPSQSKANGVAVKVAELGERFTVTDKDVTTFGCCVHQIYCGLDRNHTTVFAQSLIKSYGVKANATDIIEVWDKFVDYLTATYGEATSVNHELAFKQAVGGQIVSGSIDYAWNTAEGCVLIDYKTFPGKIADALNSSSTHYAGLYKGQLDCYTTALEKAGRKVIDRLIFYPSLGLVVKVI